VTRESDALDLEGGVFSLKDPKRIAASLKRSERSRRRKAEPYRSALSMLVFYINRAGKNLPASRRRTLERAKGELERNPNRKRKQANAAVKDPSYTIDAFFSTRACRRRYWYGPTERVSCSLRALHRLEAAKALGERTIVGFLVEGRKH
jgi:hypothetical protein